MNNSAPQAFPDNPMGRILGYLHDPAVVRVRITLPGYRVPSRNTTKWEHWAEAVRRNRGARAALVMALLTGDFVAESSSSIIAAANSTREIGIGKT